MTFIEIKLFQVKPDKLDQFEVKIEEMISIITSIRNSRAKANKSISKPIDITIYSKNTNTIEMIKGLGHKIVFEGVEEEIQINQVKEMKVDYVQGYFYSKPISAAEFEKWLQ